MGWRSGDIDARHAFVPVPFKTQSKRLHAVLGVASGDWGYQRDVSDNTRQELTKGVRPRAKHGQQLHQVPLFTVPLDHLKSEARSSSA